MTKVSYLCQMNLAKQTTIPFHTPFLTGKEASYVEDAIRRNAGATEGYYAQSCQSFLTHFTGTRQTLLTSSCTHALEMCAILLNIQAGDEVIMSSFTFVSAANAFVLRGAKIVFVDIRPDTMNMDEQLIEAAITERTKAIVVMHYGGVACEMDTIMGIATRHDVKVIEDAAHCIDAYYSDRHLGTIGHLGTLSFHYTKNIHCGEGGALLINDDNLIERAEVIREKGTNRKQFFRGQVDKYSWVDIGSSYLLSELNAAFLWAQLQAIEQVSTFRKSFWSQIHRTLDRWTSTLYVPMEYPRANGHIFYCKSPIGQRAKLMQQLANAGIQTSFHYVPLHSASAAKDKSRFFGADHFTTQESERLIRLPIYPEIPDYLDHLYQVLDKMELDAS